MYLIREYIIRTIPHLIQTTSDRAIIMKVVTISKGSVSPIASIRRYSVMMSLKSSTKIKSDISAIEMKSP